LNKLNPEKPESNKIVILGFQYWVSDTISKHKTPIIKSLDPSLDLRTVLP